MRLVTSGSQGEATQSFTVAARGRRETFQLVTLGYTGGTERGTYSVELSVVFDQGESVLPSLPAHKNARLQAVSRAALRGSSRRSPHYRPISCTIRYPVDLSRPRAGCPLVYFSRRRSGCVGFSKSGG